jgi:hypothetical protein
MVFSLASWRIARIVSWDITRLPRERIGRVVALGLSSRARARCPASLARRRSLHVRIGGGASSMRRIDPLRAPVRLGRGRVTRAQLHGLPATIGIGFGLSRRHSLGNGLNAPHDSHSLRDIGTSPLALGWTVSSLLNWKLIEKKPRDAATSVLLRRLVVLGPAHRGLEQIGAERSAACAGSWISRHDVFSSSSACSFALILKLMPSSATIFTARSRSPRNVGSIRMRSHSSREIAYASQIAACCSCAAPARTGTSPGTQARGIAGRDRRDRARRLGQHRTH